MNKIRLGHPILEMILIGKIMKELCVPHDRFLKNEFYF